MVFDIGGRGDDGFNDAAARGMERAIRELGAKALYIDARRSLGRDLALDAVAASDVGMIVGVGFAFTDPFNELAVRYPGKKFVCVDYSVRYDDQGHVVPPPENLAALTFKEEEGAYPVGAIAAWKSRTGKIGFIGGIDNPVIRQIGLNVFSDPLFEPFPQLITLVRKVAAEKEETGNYSFYRRGSDAPTVKEAFWKTISLHGTEWRLIITCARDSMEL